MRNDKYFTWRWSSALSLVKLGNDGLHDVLHLLLLGLELVHISLGVVLQPLDLLIDDLLDLALLVL